MLAGCGGRLYSALLTSVDCAPCACHVFGASVVTGQLVSAFVLGVHHDRRGRLSIVAMVGSLFSNR